MFDRKIMTNQEINEAVALFSASFGIPKYGIYLALAAAIVIYFYHIF